MVTRWVYVSIVILHFIDFAFIDLLIWRLVARREIKFSPKIGLNFKISPRSQTIIFGRAMYDGAIAQRKALNLKPPSSLNLRDLFLPQNFISLARARHKIFKILLKF
ncbi:hypothetical protein [uncultured Campylobacter sp.]|uniref:hypothetical protein n=1 Tax=uncultured Campylobacter sp. TaxID=218934 RepID=UPI0026074B16|nr:hypothetical protein [uncultured Campylobacter sp.]